MGNIIYNKDRVNEKKKLLIIEGAKIRFRNFKGEAGKYNREGDRSFCVDITDPEIAQQLTNDGWNVRILPARSVDEDPIYYLQVKVSYNNRPPKIYLVTSKSEPRPLSEETVGMLDAIDIEHVDVTIRPYHYEVRGNSGISAYVQELWVTMEEGYFDDKYRGRNSYTPDDVDPFE